LPVNIEFILYALLMIVRAIIFTYPFKVNVQNLLLFCIFLFYGGNILEAFVYKQFIIC